MSASTVMRGGLKAADRWAGAAGRALTEALFPAKCYACGVFIESRPSAAAADSINGRQNSRWLGSPLEPFVCRSCSAGIQPVASPICDCCGRVFASRVGKNHTCQACIEAPNYFQRARSALVYTDPCARLVQRFKYNGKMQLARPLGMILWRAFELFWPADEFDLIVPVPLHRNRLKQRGFNQVVMMMRRWAQAAGQLSGSGEALAFDRQVIERVVPTRPQTGLSRNERPVNLRRAFGLKQPQAVAGRRLLVVDDVYTTGATVNECARLLRHHGAARVDVLTLARVV